MATSFPTEEPKTTKQKILEAGANLLQSKDPIKSFKQHLTSISHLSGEPSRQYILHHFVNAFNEEFAHALLFDGDLTNSKLVGIQYIISEKVFLSLPENEKKLWHPLQHMVRNGYLVAPSLPAMAEKPLMTRLSTSYAKSFLFWETKEDTLPFGIPQIIIPFSAETPANESLIRELYDVAEMKIADVLKRRERLEETPTASATTTGASAISHPISTAAATVGASTRPSAVSPGESYQLRLERVGPGGLGAGRTGEERLSTGTATPFDKTQYADTGSISSHAIGTSPHTGAYTGAHTGTGAFPGTGAHTGAAGVLGGIAAAAGIPTSHGTSRDTHTTSSPYEATSSQYAQPRRREAGELREGEDRERSIGERREMERNVGTPSSHQGTFEQSGASSDFTRREGERGSISPYDSSSPHFHVHENEQLSSTSPRSSSKTSPRSSSKTSPRTSSHSHSSRTRVDVTTDADTDVIVEKKVLTFTPQSTTPSNITTTSYKGE